MSVHHISGKAQLDALLRNVRPSQLVVLDFGAAWCGPCRMIKPFFAQMAKKYPETIFVELDEKTNRDNNATFGVRGFPTFVFLKNHAKVEQFSGANPQRLEATILKHSSGSTFTGVGFASGGSRLGKSRLLTERHTSVTTTPTVAAAAAPVIDEELQLATLLAVTGLTPKEGGEKSLAIVHKILTNAIKHPDDEKYRTLKLSNNAIKKYICSFAEASQILKLAGFIEEDDGEGSRRLRLPAKGSLEKIQQIVTDIAKLAPKIATKTKAPASKNKAYQKRMDGLSEDQRRRQQERERLLQQIKLDQKEKAASAAAPASSKAVPKPKGGARMTTFKDIGVDLNKKGG